MPKKIKGNPVTNILRYVKGKNKRLRNTAIMLYEMDMNSEQISKQLGVSISKNNTVIQSFNEPQCCFYFFYLLVSPPREK